MDTADARMENGQRIFDLRDKGALLFLEGHLHEVADAWWSRIHAIYYFQQ